VKAIQLVVTTALTVATAMVGIYAIAETTAATMAATFVTDEASRHTQSVEFEGAAKRISAEHAAARAKCKPLTGTQKAACNAELRAQERRAFALARRL